MNMPSFDRTSFDRTSLDRAGSDRVSSDRVSPDRDKPVGGAPSLDEIFRRSVARKPAELALADQLDKVRVTGSEPRRLTFAEADDAVSALAAHFISAGLPEGSIVALQLPNTVEAVLTTLALWRAGLVAAWLPLLWRHAELTDALNRIGARALVTTARIDGVSHADLMMQAAAEVFSIRHVCGFGDQLPEGMASLDDVLARPSDDPLRFPPTDIKRAALITFDVTAEGTRVIPRSEAQTIAGGLAVVLDADIRQGARILSTLTPSSFAGLCTGLVAWLISGGTLALHHPFDADAMWRQIADEGCDVLVAPAPLLLRIGERDFRAVQTSLRSVIGLWRTPEQAAGSASWFGPAALTDLYAFGEIGLLALRRGADGDPAPIHQVPRSQAGGAPTAMASEAVLTRAGTLGLKGPMVPLAAYAPPRRSEETLSTLLAETADYVDTGYAARLDRKTQAICITSPPSGIVAVGGYRFLARDLNEWAQRLAQGAMLTALPDRMSGHRLAGRASENSRARAALAELGLNPLMVEAFRDRTAAG